jgi:hypothetical protein
MQARGQARFQDLSQGRARRILGMIAPCVMLSLFCSTGLAGEYVDTARLPASLDRKLLPPIRVGVLAPPDIKPSLVNRIFAEAQAIWGPTGITFEWHRITSEDAARTWQLVVTFDDSQDSLVGRRAALGWIPFTTDGPEPSIHLSRASAEALIRSSVSVDGVPVGAHEILVGRTLGRALSHELGHYLLKSKLHTRRGLMRANWLVNECLSIGLSGFELTAQQREAVAQHVPQDPLTRGSNQGGRVWAR